jgi:hypothetical protein
MAKALRAASLTLIGGAGVAICVLVLRVHFGLVGHAIFGVLLGAAVIGTIALLPATFRGRHGGKATAFVATIGVYAALTAVAAPDKTSTLPTCTDVGNSKSGVKDTDYYGAFRGAYEKAGGRATLGCPRADDTSGFVHKWGEGYSQDLQGGNGLPARLMILPPNGPVVVMQGTLNRDYTNPFTQNSAPQLGYPTSHPVACGNAKVLPLVHGRWAPGGMVTSVDQQSWVWLAKPFWLRYMSLGGPFGRLGRPVGQSDPTDEQPLQRFEHGWLVLSPDKHRVETDREARGMGEVLFPVKRCIPTWAN